MKDTFFNDLEQVLVHYIGPVAPYIIEDVLTDLGEKREQFEPEKFPLLIEAISREISDEKKRVGFQQEMLKRIKIL